MKIIPNLLSVYEKRPVYQLIISLTAVLVIGTILFFLFILAGSRIFGTDPGILENPLEVTGVNEISFIKFTLIVQDISFFIIPALFIITVLNRNYHYAILPISSLRIKDVVLVVILAFCSFPLISLVGKLNAEMVLPDRLSGLEQWMREKEDHAGQLLSLLVNPATFWGMLMNIITIAAIPAISEELIFRGVFQRIFEDLFRSGNLAVMVTSFLFSAIHLQFYGFLPRLILGLIFGYLFLWSRNLWLPVIAHFLNNAVPVLGAFIRGWDTINQPSDMAADKKITLLVVSLAIGIGVLYWFRMRSSRDKNGNQDANNFKTNNF